MFSVPLNSKQGSNDLHVIVDSIFSFFFPEGLVSHSEFKSAPVRETEGIRIQAVAIVCSVK